MKDKDIMKVYNSIKSHWENYDRVARDMGKMLNDKSCMGHDRQATLEAKTRYQGLADGLLLAMGITESLLKERGAM